MSDVESREAPQRRGLFIKLRPQSMGAGPTVRVRVPGLRAIFCLRHRRARGPWAVGGGCPVAVAGRDPDLVRVFAAICPGLVALGALIDMHHPAAPTGSPCTQDGVGPVPEG
jgi:hypothetical protein